MPDAPSPQDAAQAAGRGAKGVAGKVAGRPAWVYLLMAGGIVVIAYVMNQRRKAEEAALIEDPQAEPAEGPMVDPGYFVPPAAQTGAFYGNSEPYNGEVLPSAAGPGSMFWDTFWQRFLDRNYADPYNPPTGGSPGEAPAVHVPAPQFAEAPAPAPPPPPPPAAAPPPKCPASHPNANPGYKPAPWGCWRTVYKNVCKDNGKRGAARRAWTVRQTWHNYYDGREVMVSEDKIRDGC